MYDKWLVFCKGLDISITPDLLLSKICSNAFTISEWNIQSLPSDEFSITNGIIVTKSYKFPLLIDPQGQAKKWI